MEENKEMRYLINKHEQIEYATAHFYILGDVC